MANQPANPQGKPQYMATILPGSVMAEMLSKTDIMLSRLGHVKKKLPIQSDDVPAFFVCLPEGNPLQMVI